MEKAKYIQILKKGPKAWNKWRENNQSVTKPDLSGVDLSGINMSWANLNGASFMGSNLSGADCSYAEIVGGNFIEAELIGTNFSWAIMSNADFNNANLYEADLAEAELSGANFNGADLCGAYFLMANLKNAYFVGANLKGASFDSADLAEADLSKANLEKTYFDSANLSGANLSGANLCSAIIVDTNLCKANLSGAELMESELSGSDFTEANLSGASFRWANPRGTNFSKANLREADLKEVRIIGANFNGAELIGTNLSGSSLINTNFSNAHLINCYIYGISAWDICLDGSVQRNLNISSNEENRITVDDLDVAQFVYLLFNNQKIRNVIDTITSKIVLILGRFSKQRKPILDDIRETLKEFNYVPIVMDFAPPSNRDLTETITLLARMAKFIIVDVTAPRSSPHELAKIIEQLPSVPIQPIVHYRDKEYGMFEHYANYPWLMQTCIYSKKSDIIKNLKSLIIDKCEQKRLELFENKKLNINSGYIDLRNKNQNI